METALWFNKTGPALEAARPWKQPGLGSSPALEAARPWKQHVRRVHSRDGPLRPRGLTSQGLAATSIPQYSHLNTLCACADFRTALSTVHVQCRACPAANVRYARSRVQCRACPVASRAWQWTPRSGPATSSLSVRPPYPNNRDARPRPCGCCCASRPGLARSTSGTMPARMPNATHVCRMQHVHMQHTYVCHA